MLSSYLALDWMKAESRLLIGKHVAMKAMTRSEKVNAQKVVEICSFVFL